MNICECVCGFFFYITYFFLTMIYCVGLLGIVDYLSASLEEELDITFLVAARVVSFALWLFSIIYACLCVIGSCLGFLNEVIAKMIGLIMLIIIHLFFISFCVANCVIIIWWYKLSSDINRYNDSTTNSTINIGIGISACQVAIVIYGIKVIICVCKKEANNNACYTACKKACKRKDIEMVGM